MRGRDLKAEQAEFKRLNEARRRGEKIESILFARLQRKTPTPTDEQREARREYAREYARRYAAVKKRLAAAKQNGKGLK